MEDVKTPEPVKEMEEHKVETFEEKVLANQKTQMETLGEIVKTIGVIVDKIASMEKMQKAGKF